MNCNPQVIPADNIALLFQRASNTAVGFSDFNSVPHACRDEPSVEKMIIHQLNEVHYRTGSLET